MSQHDVGYMIKTRDYYRAQGYETDYQWAHNDHTPFTSPAKILSESRVSIVTTAMPDTVLGREKRQVYVNPSFPVPESMYTEELSWHKNMTHTRDVASFLPLAQLRILAEENFIGSIAEHYSSVPTEYSQQNTIENDAPQILRQCLNDQVDLAILVPL